MEAIDKNSRQPCNSESTRRSAEGKTTVIYHKDCFDGFGGAWAAHSKLPNALYIPQAYHDEFPDLGDTRKLFIIDFSFDRNVMVGLHERLGADNVVLLDHHITAKDELAGVPNCHVDLTRSGAVMAWQYFSPDTTVPALLKYVEDRDLWKWQLPYSRAVSAYIGSWFGDRTFDRWNILDSEMSSDLGKVIGEGNAILRANQQLVEQACSYVHTVTIDGYEVPAVQSGVLQSEIGARLIELHPHAPFAAVYIKDKGRTRWSLRSHEGGHNVAETARKLGGGGHPAAAGFTTN